MLNKYTKGAPITQKKYNAILNQINRISDNSTPHKNELKKIVENLRIGAEAKKYEHERNKKYEKYAKSKGK